MREFMVPVDGGELAVRDYGGDGPEVLLLHPPVFTLEVWSRIADLLSDSMHLVSYDMRGHGASTAGLPGAQTAPDGLFAVAAATGLSRPLLVGQELFGMYAVAAATRAPERFSGVVLVDSPALGTVTQSREQLDFLSSPEVWGDVVGRGRLGLVVPEADLERTVDELVVDFAQEWLVGDHDPELLRVGTRRSFSPVGDGTYVRRPLVEFMQFLVTERPAWIMQGSREGVDALPLPVWAVVPDDGLYNHLVDGFGEGAGPYPRELREVSGGPHAATTHPREFAAVLVECAESLTA